MELHSQLERFRHEHDGILRLLHEVEDALRTVGSADAEARRAALTKMLRLEAQLLEIRRHCREEQQSLEAPFQAYLGAEAFEELKAEHEQLDQLTDSFLERLRALTDPPVRELVTPGRELLARLRRHIALEEGLLKQIEDEHAAEKKLSRS